MSTATYAFSGGVDSVPGYGDRWQIGFGGTWVVGETWTLFMQTTAEDFTIGVGAFDDIDPTMCFTYRNRMYLALVSKFIFSAVNDVTGYEEQDLDAGSIDWLSQYGQQDTVQALSQLQGRLVVFGALSVQLWQTDADPLNFDLVQTLDNIGTEAPASAKNIGDYDVIFLDSTGFRSLRSRETSLNAEPEDVGIPIDSLVQTDLLSVAASTCCAVVEPIGKQYWGYLNGKIYVLSRFNTSKITAWSYYNPVDSLGATFTPQKFVVHGRQVVLRTSDNGLIRYGGTNRNTYDATVPVLEIPWLDGGTPKQNKIAQGIDLGCIGGWLVKASMVPATPTMQLVHTVPSAQGTAEKDSTYDLLHIPFEQNGTHFKLRVEGDPTWTAAASISTLLFHYIAGER